MGRSWGRLTLFMEVASKFGMVRAAFLKMSNPTSKRRMRLKIVGGASALLLIAGVMQQTGAARPPGQAESHEKVHLEPHYTARQVIRYQLESTTVTTSHRDGVINDPQGASALTVVWSATVRMEVESATSDGSMRMKTTYEKSVATHDADAYDPEVEGVEQQYHDLEGKSFEFMLDSSGHATSVAGFEENQGQGADALRAWIGQMAATSGAPKEGISIGQSWESEQPVPSSPLDGLIWRTRSTYLRNEPCKPVKNGAETPEPFAAEQCAVIMTKVELSGARGIGHDATPPSYKKNNLRTSGDWSGDGESLSYIALNSGRLVSVAANSDEKMDLMVSSLLEGGTLHYQGSVKTKTQLSVLPDAGK